MRRVRYQKRTKNWNHTVILNQNGYRDLFSSLHSFVSFVPRRFKQRPLSKKSGWYGNQAGLFPTGYRNE